MPLEDKERFEIAREIIRHEGRLTDQAYSVARPSGLARPVRVAPYFESVAGRLAAAAFAWTRRR
jgi:hypothetical protein